MPALAVKFTEPPAQNVSGADVVIVAVGNAFTVTVVNADVAEHPLALVTVTVKLPLLVTLIVCKVEPVLHR